MVFFSGLERCLLVPQVWSSGEEHAESASLGRFQTCLKAILGNQLSANLLEEGGWTGWSPKVPSHPHQSGTLCSSVLSHFRWRLPDILVCLENNFLKEQIIYICFSKWI